MMVSSQHRVRMQRISAVIRGVVVVWAMVQVAALHAAEPLTLTNTDPATEKGNQSHEETDIELTNLTNQQLMARFERAPFGSVMVMTGGGFESFGPHTIGHVCQYAAIWETQHQQTMEQDLTVREMIRRGDAILPDIHSRIARGQLSSYIDNPLGDWGTADLYGAYAFVAGQIGNRETVTILVQLLREAQNSTQTLLVDSEIKEPPRLGMNGQNTAFVVTHALWHLTGRRHAFSADEWEQYLAIIGDEFVPARERAEHVPDPAIVVQKVRRLDRDPFASREWLIAQGPLIIPQLLQTLKDAAEDHAVQIAWVIDELRATERLKPELRKRYFNHRLSRLSRTTPDELPPLDDLARRRALEHLPFADFVEVALEADQKLPDEHAVSMSIWLSFRADRCLQVKFGKVRPTEGDLKAPNSPWAGVTPLADPAAEIEAAVHVLVQAIASPNYRKRRLGIQFAGELSRYSKSKPAALIEALRECWIAKLDRNAGRTMAKFRTPAGTRAVLDGLQSNDLTMLTQAVSFLDEIRLEVAEHPEVFLQLLEYTHHPLLPLRRNAVISLRRRAPEMLHAELERLAHDPDQRIREECIQVLDSHPNHRLVDILFDVANDSNENTYLRENAVSALANPEYKDHVDRMFLLLDDEDLQGYACGAIYHATGSDALAIFYSILKHGDDGGGFMYQYLERLTGAKPEQSVEAWQGWFATNPDRIPVDSKQSDRSNFRGNEREDP